MRRSRRGKKDEKRIKVAKVPESTGVLGWRNRIVSEGTKPASQFHANPLNYRTHPMNQRAAVKGSLDELGWIQRVIVNRTTGNLIDGHERVWQALHAGDTDVPFVEVELSEGEERLALAVLDPLSAMAETDAKVLDELLRETSTGDAALQELLASIGGYDDEQEATELRQLDTQPPPVMTWVLIGIPTVKFGSIAQDVERIAKMDGVMCETTANDG